MLAETFVNLLDLVEAEGRLLKRRVLQAASVVMLMSTAFLFMAITLALLLAALYQSFILWWSPPWAYLATALSSLILAGALSWITYHFSQKQ